MKRKADSELDQQERPPQPVGVRDHTKTCATDALLIMASFLPKDKDVVSFGCTSKSNFQAVKKYTRRCKVSFGDCPGVSGTSGIGVRPEWEIGLWSHIEIEPHATYFGGYIKQQFQQFVKWAFVTKGVTAHLLVRVDRDFIQLTQLLHLVATVTPITSVVLTSPSSPFYYYDVNQLGLPSSVTELSFHGIVGVSGPDCILPYGPDANPYELARSYGPDANPYKLALSSSIKKLCLGLAWGHRGDRLDHQWGDLVLPKSLTCLRIGPFFNKTLVDLKLPESVESLVFDAFSDFDSLAEQTIVAKKHPHVHIERRVIVDGSKMLID